MRHVGSDGVDLLFVAIEREHKETGFAVTPRSPVSISNQLAKCRGLVDQGFGLVVVTEVAEHLGKFAPGTVGVPLHLHHGDGSLGKTPIGKLNRVLGILPALVAERPAVAGVVLQQSVTIGIAGAANPAERSPGCRKKFRQLRSGRTPSKGRPEQDEKQRGGIDGAVVRAYAGGGPIPEPWAGGQPHLVQDLARLLLVAQIAHATLPSGEGCQGVHQLARKERARLVSGDDAVAAEQCDEPWDTGGHQAPAGRKAVGHAQRLEIGHCSTTPTAQVGRVTDDLDLASGSSAGGLDRGCGIAVAGLDADMQAPWLPAMQVRRPASDTVVNRVGCGRKPDDGRQSGFVVPESDAVPACGGLRGHRWAGSGRQAANGENVDEVGGDIQAHRHRAW